MATDKVDDQGNEISQNGMYLVKYSNGRNQYLEFGYEIIDGPAGAKSSEATITKLTRA